MKKLMTISEEMLTSRGFGGEMERMDYEFG
jgi:hypothetical protein